MASREEVSHCQHFHEELDLYPEYIIQQGL